MDTLKGSDNKMLRHHAMSYDAKTREHLRGIGHEGQLSVMLPHNPTDIPEGWWVSFGEGDDKLLSVMHAWGEYFWVASVTEKPDAEHNHEDDDRARFVSAAQIRERVEGGWMCPLSDFEATPGRQRGQALHKLLASCGYRDEEHFAFASEVLGRKVRHFRQLEEHEVNAVRQVALKEAGREYNADTEKEPWEHYHEEAKTAGLKDPEAFACRVLGLSERTALSELADAQIGECRKRVRHMDGRGQLGQRRRPLAA